MADTRPRISDATAERLRSLQRHDESLGDVITRLAHGHESDYTREQLIDHLHALNEEVERLTSRHIHERRPPKINDYQNEFGSIRAAFEAAGIERPPLTCDYCGKEFDNKGTMTVHQRSCDEKPAAAETDAA